MAEFVAASAAVLMVPSIKGFKSKLDAALGTVDAAVKVGIELKADALAKASAELEAWKKAQEEDRVKVKVDLDTKGLTKSITEIRHQYEDLSGDFKKALTLNIKVVGLALLPQLGSALGALDESVVQLSQSTLLLPGILAGAASAFGTLLVGVSGVKSAFQAYSQATKDSAQDSTRAKDAQRELTNANRDLAHAIQDAKRNQEDLNAQMRDAPLDEASALLDLKQALADYADLSGKTGLQHQRDALAVEKAESNLTNTRVRSTRTAQDLAAANKQGISGNPAVLDAIDKQTKAQEGLNTASKGGTAINKALANVAPNAADFITKVHSMAGAWTALKNSVGDKLFAGLGDDVVSLGTKLPVVQKGFGAIATEINGVVKSAIGSLKSDSNTGFLDRIFGNTAGGVHNLQAAMKPLIDSFLRLAAVGSDFLPQLGTAFTAVVSRFDAFVTKADSDGKLKKWITDGEQALKDLGNGFINIGKILTEVSDAFGATGGKGFLATVAQGTQHLAAFLDTVKGQNKLQTFFYDARNELSRFKPLLDALPELIKSVIGATEEWSGVMLPFFTTAARLLAEHPTLVSAILTAYLAWRTIGPIVSGVSSALGILKKGIDLAKDGLGVIKGKGLLGAIDALGELMSTGGILMVGIGAVAGALLGHYLEAQQQAAQATQHHADMVHRLSGEIDDLSGAITKTGLIEKLKALGGYTSGNLQGTFDVPALAEKSGLSRAQFANSLDPANQPAKNFALDKEYDTLRTSIEKGDYWKAHGADLIKQGFTLDDLAKAAGGDQTAIAKFNALGAHQPGGGPGSTHPNAYSLSDIVQGYQGIPGSTSLPGLDASGKGAAIVGGVINEESGGTLAAGQDTRANNAGVYGTDNLKPGNPFEQFGSAKAYPTPDGGTTIQVDRSLAEIKQSNPQFIKDVEGNGGQFEELGSGTQITLTKDRAAMYVDHVPAFASGGWVHGAGTGTSDSIMAKLSNKEHVTKASVAARNPALFDAMNSGAVDPRSLSRFDDGGAVNSHNLWAPLIKAGVGVGNFVKGALGLGAPGVTPTNVAILRPNPDSPLIGTGGDNVQDRAGRHDPAPAPVVPVGPPAASVRLPGFAPRGALYPSGQFVTIPGAAYGAGYGDETYVAQPDGTLRHAKPGETPSAPPAAKSWWPGVGKPPAKAAVSSDPTQGPHGATPGAPGPGNGTPHLPSNKGAPGPAVSDHADVPIPPVPGSDAAIYSPANADPGLNNPVADIPVPGPDGAPAVDLPVVPPIPGVTPLPLASAIPGVGNGPKGLPDAIQPVGILESIGSVLLDAILGFFGINPEYINTIKKGLGLFKPGTGADPGVANILGAQGDRDAQYDPLTGQQTTFTGGDASNANARATAMAQQMKGKMYQWGGSTLDGTDCSGLVMYIADAYLGKAFAGRDGGTGTFGTTLPAKGAITVSDPSQLPAGTLRIGWNADHTSGTLPDGTPFEANTQGQPIHVGAGAGGATEGGFTNWAYFPALATGGMLSGPGSGTSDSILARVSDGEFITKASVVAKNPDLFHKLNSGAIDPRSLAHFALGGDVGMELIGDPNKPKNVDGTQPTKPANNGVTPLPATAKSVLPGVDKKARAGLGAPPASQDHVLPGLSEGIDGAAAAIGNAASMAAAAASFGAGGLGGVSVGGGGGAGGGGGSGGASASLIGGATQIGAGLVKGAFNIGSSLLVGTASPGTTGSAYGAPLLPDKSQQAQPQGPQIVNQYGDIHTASYDEFYKGQQRREQQQQAPFIGALGKT